METTTVRDTIKAKRLANKVKIADVAKAVNKSPTFVAAALNGNHRLTPEVRPPLQDKKGLKRGTLEF